MSTMKWKSSIWSILLEIGFAVGLLFLLVLIILLLVSLL